jgi:DUF1365 family protein
VIGWPSAPIPMVPCLYEVTIRHSRQTPLHHRFRHDSYMWLFDLEQPPHLPGFLRRLAHYRPSDHLDVRVLLQQAGIVARRILVLTNLRVLGYVFNPITVYWCYDHDGAVIAHVAEVHNTYGDRHAYILPVDIDAAGTGADQVANKAMLVSPFYPLDGVYRMSIRPPGETLSISVVLERPHDNPFRASLFGTRRDANVAAVWWRLIRYPAAPLLGRALIQLEGLRLWLKGLEVQPR